VGEITVRHRTGPTVRFLRVGEVLTGALAVAVPLEASGAVAAAAALEVRTEVRLEEAMEEALAEATGKLKQQRQKKDPCGPSFFIQFLIESSFLIHVKDNSPRSLGLFLRVNDWNKWA